MKTPSRLLALFIASAACSLIWARASGSSITGLSGAPGDGTCTRCHSGTLNSGSGSVAITADSATYTAGQTVKLHVTVTDATMRRWGFELSPRAASATSSPLGTLAASSTSVAQVSGSSGSLQYATQTSAGTYNGTTGSASWDLVWTAPSSTASGAVTFYAVGLACNADGNDSGDLTYSTSLTLQPAAAVSTGTPKVLPQLAFGGGWSTALYFTNTSAASTTFDLNFIGEDGKALTVASLGASSTRLSLAAGATAMVEASSSGSLTSGSVQMSLPTGVNGYAVFRQVVAGAQTQEAVVPLSGTSSSTATLIFDETAYVTGVAVLNPNSSAATITITVRDESGSQLGTATLDLAANAKSAFTLRSALAALAGHRGSADFTSSGGAVSVLGLRFNDLAFTSIPAVER